MQLLEDINNSHATLIKVFNAQTETMWSLYMKIHYLNIFNEILIIALLSDYIQDFIVNQVDMAKLSATYFNSYHIYLFDSICIF